MCVLFPFYSHLDLITVKLLCMEQEDRLLSDSIKDFLNLVCLIHYTDDLLSIFFYNSLSEQTKAGLPARGPRRILLCTWNGLG